MTVATDNVESAVLFHCDATMVHCYAGDRRNGVKELRVVQELLAGGTDRITVSTYLKYLAVTQLCGVREGLAETVGTWVLPDDYWDALTSESAAPFGSALNRVVCRAAAKQGNARGIAVVVMFNGKTGSVGVREGIGVLEKMNAAVRWCAGAMASNWSGSVTDLAFAAKDIVDVK